MPFCSRCGYEARDDEPICEICGARIRANTEPRHFRSTASTQNRREAKIYEGNMHTCRHCNGLIDSFTSICPHCGAEIRDNEPSKALERFYDDFQRAKDDTARISMIKTFSIPNSKEDIYEFMFLAASNFDAKMYIEHRKEETINSAWYVKIEQCHHKAVSTLKSADLGSIGSLYSEIQAKVKQAEDNRNSMIGLGILLTVGGMFLVRSETSFLKYSGTAMTVIGIIILVMKLSTSKEQKKDAQNLVFPVDRYTPQKEGFSSWSGGKKAGWVVLNIYTLGIPAIIRSRKK